jgi:hypothetical protein
MRKSEESMGARCGLAMERLGCKDTFPVKKPESGSLPVYGFVPVKHNPLKDAVDGAGKLLGNLIGKK